MTNSRPSLKETFSHLPSLAKGFDLIISDDTAEKCAEYGELLLEENEVTNLTRLTDPTDCMIGLFLDSLLFLKHLKKKNNRTLLDIGTGGGFPGMVIAIAAPQLKVTAIDSRHHKTDFISKAAEMMNVNNIRAIHTRAQDLESDKFDFVVARAVGTLEKTLKLALPHLEKRGNIVIACSEKSYDQSVEKRIRVRTKSFPYILPGYNTTFTHVFAHKR